ncbi:signal peptidase I [Cardinium endosymbiont of Oedothorax gibbosus]|uniref:signal peptidase I n=1 Tax=Cardinium endosymbiont of Oedothorax gibbosus TaxID=931101 RepID=UPI002024B06F|nr:signal peptidase I [Cardinium endosymbiont of Oedothorax gibbosus]CAH2560147.1 Peptidase S26A, signal peptidase I family protein [Cardinium endosymbiont of Oedothorax gibbosus]
MKTSFAAKKQGGVGSAVGAIRNGVSSVFFAAMVAALIRWMVIGLYVIPSGSMEPTLLSGDFVLVSKLHYGARTPATPLQIPITHRTIPGTRIPAYLDWIELPQYRLPGLSKIKRNDVIVFNTTEGHDPPDLREYWIKRCIALPGDLVHIVHKQLYVNDTPADPADRVQYCYFMKTKRILTTAWFEKNSIRNPIRSTVPGREGYTIYTTPEKVKQLTTILPTFIQSVNLVEDQAGVFPSSIYGFNPTLGWTKDNFGPLQVPSKGMVIQMDAQNILLYRTTIERFEGKQDIRFTKAACWIDGQEVIHYTFCKDYYFAMGDNRDQSGDSRFIGFIPEDHIVGKAVMVLLSSDRSKPFFSGIRWNRLFHVVN